MFLDSYFKLLRTVLTIRDTRKISLARRQKNVPNSNLTINKENNLKFFFSDIAHFLYCAKNNNQYISFSNSNESL